MAEGCISETDDLPERKVDWLSRVMRLATHIFLGILGPGHGLSIMAPCSEVPLLQHTPPPPPPPRGQQASP